MTQTSPSPTPGRIILSLACRAATATILLLWLAGAAAPAAAQNLLANGSFDHDAGSWPLYFPQEPNHREIHYLSGTGSDLPGGSGPGAIEVFNFDTATYTAGS